MLSFRAPERATLCVFSLVGGTGRTTIAVALARLLASAGKRVLLADTNAHSLLPHFFGGREARQGVRRRFMPDNTAGNRSVRMLSLAVEPFNGDDMEQYRILQEFVRGAANMQRVVWDLSGAPLEWSAKVLCNCPLILVPLLPNNHSLVQLRATQRFLNRCHDENPEPHIRYVLTHFDERDPLHLDVQSRFRRELGPQLLQGTLRRSPLVDEAFALGRTVVDHAPDSTLVADLWRLARQLGQIEETAGEPAGERRPAWASTKWREEID